MGPDGINGSFSDFIQFAEEMKSNSDYFAPKTICIGKSFGGVVVLVATNLNGTCSDGVVLVAPALSLHPERIPWYMTNSLLNFLGNFLPKIPIQFQDGKIYLRSGFFLSFTKFLKDNIDTNLEIFKNKGIPTLILQGDKDRVVNSTSVKNYFHELEPKFSKYVNLPNRGHDLLTDGDGLDVVLDWLRSQEN
eukprot:TRINITY_DN4659_c1_g2_i6.p1 TRINITY_DN4659_c1_g2~~TRINITY_DN4659_c1_g2_i6.p1  ORF type:complete len:191 (-),score=44.61 TRINITY_DN4659_c1_g2_i6:263-835(-)